MRGFHDKKDNCSDFPRGPLSMSFGVDSFFLTEKEGN